MARPNRKPGKTKEAQDKLLPRISLALFSRYRIVAVLWVIVTVFGLLSYTTLLKRQGFPSINIPIGVISGSYLVNDAQKVDQRIAKPISDIVLKDKDVQTVQAQSQAMFYAITVQYKDGTNSEVAGKRLDQAIKNAGFMPSEATLKVEAPKFGYTARGDDGVISVYAKYSGVPLTELKAQGEQLATFIQGKHFADIQSISIVDPFVNGIDPNTGKTVQRQINFDRYGVRQADQTTFYDSVSVGFMQKSGSDAIKLDDKLRTAVTEYNSQHQSSDFGATVSASQAPDIKDQISELQRALLEGLLAVLVIGSLIIAVRASFTTVISMITVLSITAGMLFLFGYTLNTITLFSLILCLSLVVDDTIIMVEVLDAQRRKLKDVREIVYQATRKVSRAMVSATLTSALSFTPLLFVSGILGSFIRAIPITIITSLLVSLLVALFFIPLFARYLLLRPKQLGHQPKHHVIAGIEAGVANFVGRPMLWARHSTKKLFLVGGVAIVVGLVFVGSAGALFQKVTFNIFPPSKDSNGLNVNLAFNPGTSIEQAEKIADNADTILADKLGSNFTSASYYSNGDNNTAMLAINIISYDKRAVTAPQLTDQLNAAFKSFPGAKAKVSQQDVGPPASAFSVQLQTDNRPAAEKLAKDINSFLLQQKLVRPSGKIARINESTIADPGIYTRNDGKLYYQVTGNFDGTDTSTLVTLAKDAVAKEYTPAKLATFGLQPSVLKYDIGQEQQNQDSFKALALAFPIVLLAIYLLLVVQFRSLLQPLLIFMALPFSLFGITLGLFLTNNPFSFFAMLGFFALIGLSIKNTILLTDYANQLRRSGLGVVDSAVGAVAERFRPLIATSLTAVVSLIPLAVSSPFWQGLSVVLIGGLLSSTFLVITVFPYYYLGAEYLRFHISRRGCLTWLILTAILGFAVAKAGAPALIPVISLAIALTQFFLKKRSGTRTA